jgi:hypothetical protein
MRTPYDETAKELLEAAAEHGRLITEREVRGEPQRVDAVFEPTPGRLPPPGLIGRLLEHACLIEVFHEPPVPEDVRDCMCKQLTLDRERRRGSGIGSDLPRLWIISAGRPETVMGELELRPAKGWLPGVFEGARGLALGLVVVRDLPEIAETLLVRLMGNGQVLRRAVVELRTLPLDSWEQRVSQRALGVLISSRAVSSPSDAEEEVIAMEARETYDEWKQRLLAQGRAEGLARLFERKVGRTLTSEEEVRLRERYDTLGSERVEGLLLDLEPAALAAWLADPAAH